MHFLRTVFSLIFLVASSSTLAADLRLPNLQRLLQLALQSPGEGSVEVAVGLRPLLEDGVDVRWNQQNFDGSRSFSTFTAVGMGGAGITLMPGVSNAFLSNLVNVPKDTPIVIFGAGFIGTGTAWHAMHAGFTNIKIVADRFPRGAEEFFPSLTTLSPIDKYASRVGGGWIMPVSVAPHKDLEIWKSLIISSQNGWLTIGKDPNFQSGIVEMPSYVFSDPDSNANPEDKSGIKEVNGTLGAALFPMEQFLGTISGTDLKGSGFEHKNQGTKIEKFSGVVQIDTLSVLRRMFQQLATGGVKFVQQNLNAKSDLLPHLSNPKTIVMNATGNGTPEIFDTKPYTPVRGDLVIVRVPKRLLTSEDKKGLEASLWMGRHYLFVRNDVDDQYVEIVLGGTFLKGDGSLDPRPKTSVEILGTWLQMVHSTAPLNELLPSKSEKAPCSQVEAYKTLAKDVLNSGATNMGQKIDF